MTESGFAFIRKEECEALRRCKPSAALALIHIRSTIMTRESEPFLCGSRDFKECGLGRDGGYSALSELQREGLIERMSAGSFTRGKKAVWRLVHTKEHARNTAGKSANLKTDTAGKPANIGRNIRQPDENTVGKSATLQDTSSTSSQKSKEEEVSALDRETRQRAFRDQLGRIEQAARARGMTDKQFIDFAGGREQADLLACQFLENAEASLSGEGGRLGEKEREDAAAPEVADLSSDREPATLGDGVPFSPPRNRPPPSQRSLDKRHLGYIERAIGFGYTPALEGQLGRLQQIAKTYGATGDKLGSEANQLHAQIEAMRPRRRRSKPPNAAHVENASC